MCIPHILVPSDDSITDPQLDAVSIQDAFDAIIAEILLLATDETVDPKEDIIVALKTLPHMRFPHPPKITEFLGRLLAAAPF